MHCTHMRFSLPCEHRFLPIVRGRAPVPASARARLCARTTGVVAFFRGTEKSRHFPDDFAWQLGTAEKKFRSTKRRTPTGAMGHEEVVVEDASDADVEAKRAQMMVRPGPGPPRARPPRRPLRSPARRRLRRTAPSLHRADARPPRSSAPSFPPRATGPATRHRGFPPRGPRGSPRGGERRGGPARERAIVPRAVRDGSRRGGE